MNINPVSNQQVNQQQQNELSRNDINLCNGNDLKKLLKAQRQRNKFELDVYREKLETQQRQVIVLEEKLRKLEDESEEIFFI